MAVTTPAYNRIVLKQPVRYEEAPAAAGSIYPGNLLRLVSSSGTKVNLHNVAGGYAEKAFAIENGMEGVSQANPTPGGMPDPTALQGFTAYPSGGLIPYVICQSGAKIQALLKGGTNYAIGDKLISDGTGMLQKDTADSTVITKECIAIIEEAINLSSSAGALALGAVRII